MSLLKFLKPKSREKELINSGDHAEWISEIMVGLSKSRPLFRSESDLRNALSSELSAKGYKCEKGKAITNSKVDLWVEGNGGKTYAIQLRHKTAKLDTIFNGEEFQLKTHGAQDQGRYDYICDVVSLEKLVTANNNIVGFALLLTNDHLYWQEPTKTTSVDADFHLTENRVVSNELKWDQGASTGTKKDRETPLVLMNTYKWEWSHFSSVNSSKNGEFRYLCTYINKN
jgi:hypothetical protein